MSAERIADLERELAYTLRLLSDARTQHTEWVVAHQKDADAAWREVAEAKRALSEASSAERARCIACLPTTWLDPLLTGPRAVIKPPMACSDIEHLIAGIKARMEAL